MKTMTCRQLGGACDAQFHGITFEQIAAQSKQHGLDMLRRGDAAHLKAMSDMRAQMSDPQLMQRWMQDKRAEFEALPEDPR